MKIENTYDEVLFAAVQAGLEPDDSDVAQVRVPAGEDPQQFAASIRSTASRIAAFRKQGNNGAARKLADEAQAAYLAKFEQLMPIPAGRNDDTSLAEIGARMFGR
ncbi:hypothetical protein [Nocardioides caldifontis]|uniref:hypothetical protein n=1 Tax=Nocardioides caldifontis TaxID=2588938 RepID=UPI0011E05838|nr:hypothetical protein [Nocardioides caldifontis]